MTPHSPAMRHLDAAGIQYRLHEHNHPVRSVVQAAEERGMSPDQIVRTLVFRLEADVFVIVLMPGPGNVSWPKLRHYVGVSRLTMASREEVLHVTGYVPGMVSPFGLPGKVRMLADQRLRNLDQISTGAGLPNAGLILHRRDLETVLALEYGDFRA